MKSTAAVLGTSLLLMGSSCVKRPDPPTAVQVKVPSGDTAVKCSGHLIIEE